MKAFRGYHPFVNAVYFCSVLALSLWLMHPAILVISLLGALCCATSGEGFGKTAKRLVYLLPFMLLTAAINPLFTHRGVTTLAYLPSGNPLTLESILFGIAAAVMLGAVIAWFWSLSALMTSDKIMQLLGRISPSLALLLSMTLGFVPKLTRQWRLTSQAQLGQTQQKGIFQKIRAIGRVLAGLVSWSLESALDTADSMRNRGYGLSGRTSYAPIRWQRRDSVVTAVTVALTALVVLTHALGGFDWRYYPSLTFSHSALTWLGCGLFAVLCAWPIILQREEGRAWRMSQSAI